MSTDLNRSVPLYREQPPRPLSAAELAAVLSIADALIGPAPPLPTPSELPDFPRWVDRALAARRDVFENFAEACVGLGASIDLDSLRGLAESEPERFELVWTLVAGAYLMVPEVREAIGYPGQERKHPRFDEAAEQIMDGILDPVIARGPVYRDVSDLPSV